MLSTREQRAVVLLLFIVVVVGYKTKIMCIFFTSFMCHTLAFFFFTGTSMEWY